MNVDWELKNALKREEPRDGFAARVMARVAGPGLSAAAGLKPGLPAVWRAVAAAILLALGLGGWTVHQVQGQRARRQVLLALRIAGAKVAHAQRQVREIGSHPAE